MSKPIEEFLEKLKEKVEKLIAKELKGDYIVKCWETGAFTVKHGNTRGRLTRVIHLRIVNKKDNSLFRRFEQEYKSDDETTIKLITDEILKYLNRDEQKTSKILKVTIEFDDHIQMIEGKEAEKWDKHCNAVVQMSSIHGLNPFESDPINWKKVEKHPQK